MPDGATANFRCPRALFGYWVSVNKTDTAYLDNPLQLREVRVFGYVGELILQVPRGFARCDGRFELNRSLHKVIQNH